MLSYAKKLVATTLVSGTLVLGGLAPMAAAAPVVQGGLVNVNVGDIEVIEFEDVNVAVAAQIAANLCDVADVGAINVAILGQAVTALRTGDAQTICNAGTEDIVTIQR
jgi:hypothetical protein